MIAKPRILVLRGGAIGDFILTLPALRLLRETFAHCHIEVLGYRHIAELALRGSPVPGANYADFLQNIEHGPLAGFFARNGSLSPELCAYFAGFQQVVSWLYDPDGIFEANVKRAGVKHYLSAYTKITDDLHASAQLARGLERLALYLEDSAARLIPDAHAQQAAQAWLDAHGASDGFVAIHPGSGSPRKNWPRENWLTLAGQLTQQGHRLLLIGGEADQPIQIPDALHARSLPLATLGALLTRCAYYIGHDTGISHLAAAVGAKCTLLFGPTDPAIWAPLGANVRIIRAEDGDLEKLSAANVVLEPPPASA